MVQMRKRRDGLAGKREMKMKVFSSCEVKSRDNAYISCSSGYCRPFLNDAKSHGDGLKFLLYRSSHEIDDHEDYICQVLEYRLLAAYVHSDPDTSFKRVSWKLRSHAP